MRLFKSLHLPSKGDRSIHPFKKVRTYHSEYPCLASARRTKGPILQTSGVRSNCTNDDYVCRPEGSLANKASMFVSRDLTPTWIPYDSLIWN